MVHPLPDKAAMSRPQRVPCAGAVVFDERRRLLLIRRAHEPGRGRWSLPGGRCEPGEGPQSACVREVAEETGLEVRVLRHAGRVERDGPRGPDGAATLVYAIDDYVCEVLGGGLRAGDDADAAAWASAAELAQLEAGSALTPQLWDCLAQWGLLPD
jgi:ADP-ribose pyrophosphatase YjhB (NUDIX family)